MVLLHILLDGLDYAMYESVLRKFEPLFVVYPNAFLKYLWMSSSTRPPMKDQQQRGHEQYWYQWTELHYLPG